MARTKGPFGPSGAALRPRPGDDPLGAPAGPSAAQWPAQPQGFGDPSPQATQQGYHFPPADTEPAFGFGGQQLMSGQQQWGEPQPGYELAYQTYAPADAGPGPFQSAAPQGYDSEPDYADDYYEDEEPRRGRRLFLIVVALVGAIGVGGALAYGYRSFVAPQGGRVPVVKADPNVKAKPDARGGKAVRGEEQPAGSGASEQAQAEGPRTVKPIPIGPGGSAAAPESAPAAVPGITLYQPPRPPGAQAPADAAPPPSAEEPPAPGRVEIGSRPPQPSVPDEGAPAAPPPVRQRDEGAPAAPPAAKQRSVPVQPAPVQTASLTPKLPTPKPTSSGLGFVAVLSSQKTSMDALMLYADLRDKYPDVLRDKTPDVQEADLSDRNLGTMYRLVVGPPGPHNAARVLCTQLKAAGYEGCWVKEY